MLKAKVCPGKIGRFVRYASERLTESGLGRERDRSGLLSIGREEIPQRRYSTSR